MEYTEKSAKHYLFLCFIGTTNTAVFLHTAVGRESSAAKCAFLGWQQILL